MGDYVTHFMVPPYKQRVLAEAAKELAAGVQKRPKESLAVFKRFRKLEEHRLKLWHTAGGGGREIARQRSDLIDILFRELLDSVTAISATGKTCEPFVVMAFGGYGRREMNPFSDVDIMFLLDRGKPGAQLEEIIRQTLVALWDLGFKVGHSTRSLAQAIAQANDDMLTKTSMLECRYLLGSRDIFNDFKGRFERDCVKGKEPAYVQWRFQNQAENRVKYGASVFMQEPNIKNGCGGLRDYQNVLWIAQFLERIGSLPKLVEKKFLRNSERKRLENAYDFLLRTRTEMHYQNGRPIDSLTLQLQGKVATGLHYPEKSILRRCEAFMRDYYSQTREIHQISTSVIERMNVQPAPQRASRFFGLLPSPKPAKPERFDGFIAKDRVLYPQTREIFTQDPFRLIRVFQHAQIRGMTLSTELQDLIRRRVRLIDRTFQYARVSREIFMAILSRKGEVGKALRGMHNVGVLGKYIPEFGALDCLVQHEFFHRYTTDEHTLVCIEKLDSVILSEERKLAGYRSILQKLEDAGVLYLAILLHDTGKAANSRHHEEESTLLAHRVARRLQLSPDRRRMLLLLVDSHYTLSHTAQTRNLEDPKTISDFAVIVKNRANLDALMLLTLADGMGTSDQNWSDWKEGLVWLLYRKTCEYLEAGPKWIANKERDQSETRQVVQKMLGRDYEEEVGAHFDYMPERYFHAFDAPVIADHLRLFRAYFERRMQKNPESALASVFKWIARPEQGHSEVWVCGWDRERLLERIAGAFVSVNINILSADIFTRGDNLALDIFRVCNTRLLPVTGQREIDRVESRLTEALSVERYDFTPLIGKEVRMKSYRVSGEIGLSTSIVIDNKTHPFFTIIEVQTPDRMGLLYSLLRAFSEARVSIQTSRITTEVEMALDTFYVTGADHGKIENRAELDRLQRLLLRAAGESFDKV
jgi:[protein-PII] uridylyltransferase